jgi:peptide-methionine (R)-S-oxide reductase
MAHVEGQDPRDLSDDYWRRKLTPEQYRVLRRSGTERPFSGALLHVGADGTFACAGCGQPLFSTHDKFDSGSGWPSFLDVLDATGVELREDRSHGMVRTEVRCGACGGHLGHRFDDGPRPTGLRYCINSAALEFRPELDG